MKVTKIIDTIARGGFGRVDRVEIDNTDVVAMKVFDPKPPSGQTWDIDKLRQRFIREVKIQKCLDSNLFIQVLGYNVDDLNPFYLMPIADKNFQQQIIEDRNSGNLNLTALSDILNALESLHRLGYVHRDLTPRNILYHDGKWKLSDFGLVLPPSELTSQLTSVHSAWGTQMYCAPEQAKDFHRATIAADIYSFGCILHDYISENTRAPFARHSVNNNPLGIIVEKCTEIDVEKRIKSVSTLRELLFRVANINIGKAMPKESKAWIQELDSINLWDSDKIDIFARYLRDNSPERHSIFISLDNEKLASLRTINNEAWEEIVDYFSSWSEGSFDFGYCDVLAGRLEVIFAHGSITAKARAAIAMAKLGSRHNRWFVMGRLLSLTNASCDPAVAERIAIEIIVRSAKQQFEFCVKRINRSTIDFHPQIASTFT